MEIENMNLEEIRSAIAQMAEEARNADAPIDGFEERAKKLSEREAELVAIEQRKADAAAINSGADAKTIEVIEERKTKMFEVSSKEYRDAYVRNVFKIAMSDEEKRALTAAANVIPQMTVNEVVGKFKEAPILNYVSVSQFPSYVRFPKVTADADAAAAAVGGSISEGTNTIGYCDLTPNEYTKLITLTADIQNMAIDALHDWLVNDIVTNIRAKVAADVLVGNGTNKCSGITATVSASATNLHSTVTKADLLGVMAALPAQYHAGAIWVMTPSVFYSEVMAAATLNDYVINDGFTQKLFGHDVVLMSEACISTKETIFFGDPKSYKLNFFKAIEIKPFETATSLSTQYRGGALVDGELADASAFVRFAKA